MMRAEQEAARCKKNIKNSGTSLNFEISKQKNGPWEK